MFFPVLNRQRRQSLTRQRRAASGAAKYSRGETPEKQSIGNMSFLCSKCGAFKFEKETISCCSNGKVHLEPLQEPPPLLKNLLDGEHVLSSHFFKNIRCINSSFALGSTCVDIRPPPGQGPSVFRIVGEIIHHTSTLHPQQNNPRTHG